MEKQFAPLTYEVEVKAGKKLVLPPTFWESVGPGRWLVTVQPLSASSVPVRRHAAFLNGYAPGDEGLYDDCHGR